MNKPLTIKNERSFYIKIVLLSPSVKPSVKFFYFTVKLKILDMGKWVLFKK